MEPNPIAMIFGGALAIGTAIAIGIIGKAMIDAGKKQLYEETYARLTA